MVDRVVNPVSLAYRAGSRHGVEAAIGHLSEIGEPLAAAALKAWLRTGGHVSTTS
jgi:hypothetical protein